MKNSLQLVSPTPWAVSIIDEINKYFEITAPKGAMHFISKHLWSYFFYKLQLMAKLVNHTGKKKHRP